MSLIRWTALAAIGLAAAGSMVAEAQQQPEKAHAASKAKSPNGPWIGTWKRRGTGLTLFKMWVDGDQFHYTITSAPPGSTTLPSTPQASLTGRFDGKPYPEKGNPNADFNAFTLIDDHTYALDDLKDGKVTGHITITISADGKTRTSVATRKNEKGEEVTSTNVYDRVE
jgi:hypothetical protein